MKLIRKNSLLIFDMLRLVNRNVAAQMKKLYVMG